MNEQSTSPVVQAQTQSENQVSIEFEWDRIAVLALTLVVLFFYTRPCPFPASTYWDLLAARIYDLNIGWTFPPESLSYGIVSSSAAMAGLKSLYHISFFILCCILMSWVFKSREMLPGIIIVGLFAFAMQPLLSLRCALQLMFVGGLMTFFYGDWLKDGYGVAIIPVTAAASGFGLNSWLLVALVACHALFRENLKLSWILCALIGLLFFPEGAASSVSYPMPLSMLFQPQEDAQLLNLLAGIFLLPNLLFLPKVSEEIFPNIIFYALSGLLSLMNPLFLPVFIFVGAVILLETLSEIEPFSLGTWVVGAAILTVIVHLFLFLSPSGFKLNLEVRRELGPEIALYQNREIKKKEVDVHDVGELVWKGIINLNPDDIQALAKKQKVFIVRTDMGYEVQPDEKTEDRLSGN